MNKKLVALAVAGILAAPLAQAQTANVTLYGRVNLDMEWVKAKQANNTDPNMYRVSTNSSRFGIKGSESLGGGLTAIFQIESSANVDATGGTIAGRDTYAGLQGSWGTLKLGFFSAPYDDILGYFGNTNTYLTSVLSTGSVWANDSNGGKTPIATGAVSTGGGFDSRLGNSLRYDTPTMSGFRAAVQLAALDTGAFDNTTVPGGTGQQRHAYVLGAGGYYANGPFGIGVGYEGNQKVRGNNLNDSAWSVAGSYNFGKFQLGAVWERLDYDINTSAGVPAGSLTRDFYGFSGLLTLGPGQLYGMYGHGNNGGGSSANGTRVGGVTKGPNTSVNEYQISYDYPLSKRTKLWGGYHKIVNASNATYNFEVNGIGNMCQGIGAGTTSTCGAAGQPQGFALGMTHLF